MHYRTSTLGPDDAKEETLRNSLMITCQQAQARILARAEDENRFNLQNFDSGMAQGRVSPPATDRYCVSPGVINDRKETAGIARSGMLQGRRRLSRRPINPDHFPMRTMRLLR